MSGWEPQLVGAAVTYPPHILDLLEPWFDADGPAVSDREATLTYRELADRSAALARELRAHGVRPGDCVVVHALMSRWAVVGMLGALRAGARYVAVDAAFPVARQQLMAAASGARVAVTEPGLPLALDGLSVVEMEQLTHRPADSLTEPAAAGAAPASGRGEAAYTCFTSGSTGVPKGVTVSASALAYSTAARLAYYREPVRVFLLCSSISFDSSVAGIYWTLAGGGHLVIPASRPADLVAVGRAARRWRPSHLLMVPSLYRVALRGGLAADLGSLSTSIVAGEACPPALVGEHLAALPRTRLYNEYGPTECTVWCTVHACGPADVTGISVSLGTPIPGARLYVRDSAGAPARPGEVGELYVGGPGVARPATPDPDPDSSPFRPVDDEWLYRTGDLVAVGNDGLLTFHGRLDDQLKLGAVRVERGEIEHVLTAAAGVAAAAVGVVTKGARHRVVGFVVPTGTVPDVPRIRAFMLTRLPAAALPVRFEAVSSLPVLPNGKVDHGELDRRAASLVAV
ncbi:amino acid adenylation domain-containing protein [Micromonospora craterilacus]|uniref:amino acid adenylation domain-containing protein n=1 Tax=Micromonospora craterilacus TaxID=1655439 RepID=UPI0011B5B17D|nr:amino acid adenylation domain-containing protein [Micromonospora craterilacus]